MQKHFLKCFECFKLVHLRPHSNRMISVHSIQKGGCKIFMYDLPRNPESAMFTDRGPQKIRFFEGKQRRFLWANAMERQMHGLFFCHASFFQHHYASKSRSSATSNFGNNVIGKKLILTTLQAPQRCQLISCPHMCVFTGKHILYFLKVQ